MFCNVEKSRLQERFGLDVGNATSPASLQSVPVLRRVHQP
jgi:hypothetical protein